MRWLRGRPLRQGFSSDSNLSLEARVVEELRQLRRNSTSLGNSGEVQQPWVVEANLDKLGLSRQSSTSSGSQSEARQAQRSITSSGNRGGAHQARSSTSSNSK